MGFLDNVTSAVNRGTAAAQRTGRSAQLKMQLGDLMKQRRDLAAQLGASLYDTVKDDPAMREGREPLFDGIAAIDRQRADIDDEIGQIEAAAAAQRLASTTYRCPQCGNSVSGDDLFCSGCGTPIEEVKRGSAAQPAIATGGPACPSCGAPLNDGDLFCMSCGANLDGAPEPNDVARPEGGAAPAPSGENSGGSVGETQAGASEESGAGHVLS